MGELLATRPKPLNVTVLAAVGEDPNVTAATVTLAESPAMARLAKIFAGDVVCQVAQ